MGAYYSRENTVYQSISSSIAITWRDDEKYHEMKILPILSISKKQKKNVHQLESLSRNHRRKKFLTRKIRVQVWFAIDLPYRNRGRCICRSGSLPGGRPCPWAGRRRRGRRRAPWPRPSATRSPTPSSSPHHPRRRPRRPSSRWWGRPSRQSAVRYAVSLAPEELQSAKFKLIRMQLTSELKRRK